MERVGQRKTEIDENKETQYKLEIISSQTKIVKFSVYFYIFISDLSVSRLNDQN